MDKKFKLFHGVLVVAFILVLGFGLGLSYSVSAQQGGGQGNGRDDDAQEEARTERQEKPKRPHEREAGREYAVEGEAPEAVLTEDAEGVHVDVQDRNEAEAAPGASSQPLPTFSGLNVKGAMVNTEGSLLFFDDSILYGLNDVRVGLINNSGITESAESTDKLRLKIAIAPDTPPAATIPQNASSPMAKIKFTAPYNRSTQITTMTLSVGGLCAPGAISSINISSNNPALNKEAAPNAQKKAVFSNLNWTIPAGQTAILTVSATIGNNDQFTNNTCNIGLNSADLVVSANVAKTGSARSNDFIIAPPPRPDLIVEQINIPQNIRKGVPAVFSTIIKNIGNLRPDIHTHAQLQFDYDNNGIWDENPVGVAEIQALNPGASSPQKWFQWSNPVAGTHKMKICVDMQQNVAERITESNEDNNCLESDPFTVTAPDLIVSALNPVSPTNPSRNSPITFTGTIKNNGDGNAGATRAKFYIMDQTGGPVATLPLMTVGALNASATQNVSSPWTPVNAGTYTYKLCADDGSSVPLDESDENNNCSSGASAFTVKPGPRLIIERASDTPAGGNVEQGATGIVLTKIKIRGTTTNIRRSLIWTMDCPGYTGINTVNNLKLLNTNDPTQIFTLGSFDNVSKQANFSISPINIDGGDNGTTLSLKADIPPNAPMGTACSFGIALNEHVACIANDYCDGVADGAPAYGNSFTIVGPPAIYWGTQASSPASYNVGANNTVAPITLVAGSLNTTTGPDTATAQVTSTRNPNPLNVTLTETGADTGIFTGNVTLSLPLPAASNTVFKISSNSPCQNDTLTVGLSGRANITDTVTGKPVSLCLSKGGTNLSTLQAASGQNLMYFDATASATSATTISSVVINKTGNANRGKITNIKLQRKNAANAWEAVPNVAVASIDASGNIAFNNINDTVNVGTTKNYRIIGDIAGCAGGSANMTLKVNTATVPANSTAGVFGLPTATTTHEKIPTCTASAVPFSAPSESESLSDEGNGRGLISLFGSFLPVAYAHGDAEPIGQTPTPYDPVYVYDDLYVYGNDAREPGNLFLNGTIIAPYADLQVANLQSTSDLQVLGAANVESLNVATNAIISGNAYVDGQELIVNGNTAVGGNLIVTGTLTGGDVNFSGNTRLTQLNVDTNATIGDDLTVNGNSTITGAATLNGGLNIQGGEIVAQGINANNQLRRALTVTGLTTINGPLIANAIGSFYMVANSSAIYLPTTIDNAVVSGNAKFAVAVAICGSGDIIMSCSGSLELTLSGVSYTGATINNTGDGRKSCNAVSIKASNIARSPSVTSQAVCFNPNNDASKPAGATDL